MGLSHRRRRAGPALLLLLLGCAHAESAAPSSDVLRVTELAARYALEHDVPAVLREGSVVCLRVDGEAPPPEALVRLNSGAVQVSSGASACSGPRAVLLQVGGVVVSGESAMARAGVRLGPSRVLQFRIISGEWRVLAP